MDIEKRIEVSSTNFRAAIDNLEMYDKHAEKVKAEEVLKMIEGLKEKRIIVPSEPLLVDEAQIQKFYLLDESGFRNSIDLLDNINSFRSASISGDFDEGILNKIKENIEKISSFVDEKNSSLNSKS